MGATALPVKLRAWGGALAGHWGVAIDTGSQEKPGDIAPGIRTYLAEN